MEIREQVRYYIIENFLFGEAEILNDDELSLLDSGIIDSIGVMELVAMLEDDFGLAINDEELTPNNLDSVKNITAFIGHKQASKNKQNSLTITTGRS